MGAEMPPDPYFEKDGQTIYLGDCRAILPTLPKVDLILADPPYGIDAGDQRRQKSRTKLALATDYGPNEWDRQAVPDDLMRLVVAAGVHAIVFGGNYYSWPRSSKWLVWDKDNSGDFADCELAYTNLPGAVRKIKHRWNGMLQEYAGKDKEIRYHPTQKPVPVIRWCIEQAGKGIETVGDPYGGSGTTLIAARNLGKTAWMIEISEKYCEIAAKRLAQGVLF